MSAADVEIVKTYEEAFMADMNAALVYLHEDIVVHEPQSLPYGGDHHGHEGVLAIWDAFRKCWDIKQDLKSGKSLWVLDGGPSRAICIVQLDVVARETGVPVTLRINEIQTIRDGKIADIEAFYWDTAEINRATNGVKVLEGRPRTFEPLES